MSDVTRPIASEATAALAADLLRGLRHDLNNRSNLLSLSLPTLQTAVAEAVAAARAHGGAEATVGGLPVDEAEEELGWLLGMLTERDEAAGAHVDAIQRAMGPDDLAPLAGLLDDLELLCAHPLKKLGVALRLTDAEQARTRTAEGPRTRLTRAVARLLLNAPPGLAGTSALLALDDDALHVDLPRTDQTQWTEARASMAPWSDGLTIDEEPREEYLRLTLRWASV